MRNNEKGTLKEPLAKAYTWGESITAPNVFHFQEQFAAKEGFEYHKTTDHFKVWVNAYHHFHSVQCPSNKVNAL